MPTIRKRGEAWQAQVRRSGYPALARSFATRADAVAWAREKERAIDRAELPTDIKELKRLTVADLLKRYEREITPRKRGAVFEREPAKAEGRDERPARRGVEFEAGRVAFVPLPDWLVGAFF